MKSKYVVSITLDGIPFCAFEDYSINKACNFLQTIDFDRDDIGVLFYREHPFMRFDLDAVMEVLNA